VPEAEWLNHTICIDTGCVFGGRPDGARYPEKELVSVPAARAYYESTRPLSQAPQPTQHDDLLDLEDVMGKRLVQTRLMSAVDGPGGERRRRLEVMSRFAANPKWLVYLPPTMSPCETSSLPGPPRASRARRSSTSAQGVPRSSARRSTWARAPSSSWPRRRGSASRFGCRDGGRRHLHAHGPPFFTDVALERGVSTASARAIDARLWTSSRPTGSCSTAS
jgi:hypothetical protein